MTRHEKPSVLSLRLPKKYNIGCIRKFWVVDLIRKFGRLMNFEIFPRLRVLKEVEVEDRMGGIKEIQKSRLELSGWILPSDHQKWFGLFPRFRKTVLKKIGIMRN